MRVARLGPSQCVDATVERFARLDVYEDLGVGALEADLVADTVRVTGGIHDGIVPDGKAADDGRDGGNRNHGRLAVRRRDRLLAACYHTCIICCQRKRSIICADYWHILLFRSADCTPGQLLRTRPVFFPAIPPLSCACVCVCVRVLSLTGTAGLQVHGIRVTGVEQRHGGGSGEGVDAVQERLVVQVVESAVRLSRFVCRPEEDGTADEFILNGAGSQTPALRLDLMNRETERESEGKTAGRIAVPEGKRIVYLGSAPGMSPA